jgi:penicillin-binding protein-related factor A (putative recombinase)
MARTRQQAGRYAKHMGDMFESWLDGQHAMAKRDGILAHIHHNEPKTIMMKGILSYDKKSVADYSGTLEGGRSLAVEAKSWGNSENFPRSQVDTLQAEHMQTVLRAGGLALLVVEFRIPFVQRFAVPWQEVPWRVLRSAETTTAELLQGAGWKIPMDVCYLAKFHKGGVPSSPTHFRKYPRD